MKYLIRILLVFVLLVIALPALAQDMPAEDPTMPSGAFALLVATLTAIVSTFVGSPLTTLLVNVTKRIPITSALGGQTIRLVWATVLTLAFWGVRELFGDQGTVIFDYVAKLDINNLLVVVGPMVLNWFLNIVGSKVVYEQGVKANDPFFGYQRTAPNPRGVEFYSEKEWTPDQ